ISGHRSSDFSNLGPNSYLDSGRNGDLDCDKHPSTGVPLTIVVDLPLYASAHSNRGTYDLHTIAVSLVNGFNVTIYVDNNEGCHIADCRVDLNLNCSSALAGPKDSSRKVIG
ncbi:hypothetical protein LXA43DRAFT_837170, partial [Ganoderma leucocontextum]